MDAMSNISYRGFCRLSYFLEESSLLEAPLRGQNYLRNNFSFLLKSILETSTFEHFRLTVSVGYYFKSFFNFLSNVEF